MSNVRKTTTEFIEQAKRVHGDRYDYSLVDYKNARSHVKIICSEHGVFEQTPDKHLNRKQGCSGCNYAGKKTTEQFIDNAKRVHRDRYDYSLVKYKNNQTKVKIICPEHGVFEQTPNSHLSNNGCPTCSRDNRKKTTEQFIDSAKRVHGDRYDYSLVDYKYSWDKVKIICSEHGAFEQVPSNHLQGQGCPKCVASKPEKDIMNYFQERKIPFSYNWSFPGSRYKYDFMIPCSPIPLLIEYDGQIHFKYKAHFHQSEEKFDLLRTADIKKTKLAVEKGYHILRIHHKHADEIPELLDFALEHMAAYDTADVFILEDEDYSYITDNL